MTSQWAEHQRLIKKLETQVIKRDKQSVDNKYAFQDKSEFNHFKLISRMNSSSLVDSSPA